MKPKRLSVSAQREIMEAIGEETAFFVDEVLRRLDPIRRTDCGGFIVSCNEDDSFEIHQDNYYILLRSKKDVKRLVKQLQEYLEEES